MFPQLRWDIFIRFIFILSVICMVHTSLKAQLPQTKFSINYRKAPLKDVFKYIYSKTGYNLFYSNQQINDQEKVSVILKDATANEVLSAVLGNSFEWTAKDKIINIKKRKGTATAANFVADSGGVKAGNVIRGKVKNDEGESMPGAAIKFKDTETGVLADDKGEFSIRDITNGAGILQISFVGYQTLEVSANQKKPLSITLLNASSHLNDVVVIGYGSTTKKDITGSVAQVNMEDLQKAPVASFTEALAGRVAGVQVSSNDGQPGVTQNIIIRGANSLTQSNGPLYVIDGFPVEDLQSATLNNDDIESINILKDASATAIYGARAANGVVVIVTKKGKSGSPVINFSTSQGFQSIRKKMEMMSPYEFVKYHLELKPAVTQTRYLQGYGKTLDDYANVEPIHWQDELLANTPITSIYNISLRGGNSQTKYSISGSVFDQDGILKNSGFKRYQGRLGIDQNISKKLKTGVNINYSKTLTNGQPVSQPISESNQSSALLYRVWGYRPVSGAPINLLEEEADAENITGNEIRLNPLITNNNEFRRGGITDIIVNSYLEYQLAKGLSVRVTGALNNRLQESKAFYNSNTLQGNPLNPTNTRGQWGSVSYNERNLWTNENTISYNKSFSGKSTLNMVGGFSMQGGKSSARGSAATLVPNEELGIDGLDEGTPFSITSRSSSFTLVSLFARANYNYGSRFLFTGTIRSDGSSKFPSGNRWGTFPSAAVAWNVGNEKFMKASRFISSAKLRTSYGLTGNNRVDDFAYLPSLQLPIIRSYSFGNATPTNGVIPVDLGNAELKWETTAQTDIGVDIGLFKERVSLVVDVYQKNTRDLLFFADVPFTSGYERAYMNIGKIRNRGIEIGLNTVNILTKKFKWETNFNISFNRNQIQELARDQENMFNFVSVFTQYNNSPLYLSQVGQPAGMFYGYIFDGVYQYEDFIKSGNDNYTLNNNMPSNGNDRSTIRPGDIKYRDLNGDGEVNSYDQAIIGNGVPLHSGGLSNNFYYQGFSLNVFFQWSYGNDIYNANRLFFEGNTLLVTDLNQYKSYENRWTPENPTNANFRAGGQGPAGRHSSRVVEDGSYIRLKTVSLGYDIPARYIRKLFLKGLNISVAAQNLLTWTNYSGMDPEVSVRNTVLTPGFDYSAYPIGRTIVFGLKASF